MHKENENYWQRFESTGSVGAYLDYKHHEEPAGEEGKQHADQHDGLGAARDQNRGSGQGTLDPNA